VLNHVRRGSGEPLVLIHPLGGELVVWEPLLDLLARDRDVIAVDLPGFGGSAPLSNGALPVAGLSTAGLWKRPHPDLGRPRAGGARAAAGEQGLVGPLESRTLEGADPLELAPRELRDCLPRPLPA
jgi:pimeloyl-ACP methyl ester carboxylesterase